jgi:hypothetical protein
MLWEYRKSSVISQGVSTTSSTKRNASNTSLRFRKREFGPIALVLKDLCIAS